jgi:hypothetical protein
MSIAGRLPVTATLESSSCAALEFLSSLPAGSIVAQLDDGSVAVCSDLAEADRLILESRTRALDSAVSEKRKRKSA